VARKKQLSAEAEQLSAFFSRSGYVRFQQEDRLREGRTYHKGEEVRLVANSLAELRTIRRLLRTAEFSPGRPFQKHSRWCQPLYGRETVARFLELIGKSKKK
jgi:hypothetical protein